MGTSLAFDTHKFVKDLTKTGMKTEQAEVLANHYASLLDDRIATKEDLKLLRKDVEVMMHQLWIKMLVAMGVWSGIIIGVLAYIIN